MRFDFHFLSLCCLLIFFQRCYTEVLWGWRGAKPRKPFISFKGQFASPFQSGNQLMRSGAPDCCCCWLLPSFWSMFWEWVDNWENAWLGSAPNLGVGGRSSCCLSHTASSLAFSAFPFLCSLSLSHSLILFCSCRSPYPPLPIFIFPWVMNRASGPTTGKGQRLSRLLTTAPDSMPSHFSVR